MTLVTRLLRPRRVCVSWWEARRWWLVDRLEVESSVDVWVMAVGVGLVSWSIAIALSGAAEVVHLLIALGVTRCVMVVLSTGVVVVVSVVRVAGARDVSVTQVPVTHVEWLVGRVLWFSRLLQSLC